MFQLDKQSLIKDRINTTRDHLIHLLRYTINKVRFGSLVDLIQRDFLPVLKFDTLGHLFIQIQRLDPVRFIENGSSGPVYILYLGKRAMTGKCRFGYSIYLYSFIPVF
ncbi:hypothetical protein N9112_03790 [bacterium]|nr:hypothetical protein [bacterium]